MLARVSAARRQREARAENARAESRDQRWELDEYNGLAGHKRHTYNKEGKFVPVGQEVGAFESENEVRAFLTGQALKWMNDEELPDGVNNINYNGKKQLQAQFAKIVAEDIIQRSIECENKTQNASFALWCLGRHKELCDPSVTPFRSEGLVELFPELKNFALQGIETWKLYTTFLSKLVHMAPNFKDTKHVEYYYRYIVEPIRNYIERECEAAARKDKKWKDYPTRNQVIDAILKEFKDNRADEKYPYDHPALDPKYNPMVMAFARKYIISPLDIENGQVPEEMVEMGRFVGWNAVLGQPVTTQEAGKKGHVGWGTMKERDLNGARPINDASWNPREECKADVGVEHTEMKVDDKTDVTANPAQDQAKLVDEGASSANVEDPPEDDEFGEPEAKPPVTQLVGEAYAELEVYADNFIEARDSGDQERADEIRDNVLISLRKVIDKIREYYEEGENEEVDLAVDNLQRYRELVAEPKEEPPASPRPATMRDVAAEQETDDEGEEPRGDPSLLTRPREGVAAAPGKRGAETSETSTGRSGRDRRTALPGDIDDEPEAQIVRKGVKGGAAKPERPDERSESLARGSRRRADPPETSEELAVPRELTTLEDTLDKLGPDSTPDERPAAPAASAAAAAASSTPAQVQPGDFTPSDSAAAYRDDYYESDAKRGVFNTAHANFMSKYRDAKPDDKVKVHINAQARSIKLSELLAMEQPEGNAKLSGEWAAAHQAAGRPVVFKKKRTANRGTRRTPQTPAGTARDYLRRQTRR